MKNVFQNCSLVILNILSASCFSLFSWLIKKVPFWNGERNEKFHLLILCEPQSVLFCFQEVNSFILVLLSNMYRTTLSLAHE